MTNLADVLRLLLAGDATPWSTAGRLHTAEEIDAGVRCYTAVRRDEAPKNRRTLVDDFERWRFRPWRKTERRALEKAIVMMSADQVSRVIIEAACESARLASEQVFARYNQAIEQRDAAVRERDEVIARHEEIYAAWVRERESRDAAGTGRGDLAEELASARAERAAAHAERDAALEERDAAISSRNHAQFLLATRGAK